MSRLTDKEGIYDQEIINNIIRSMEAYPSAVFLDVIYLDFYYLGPKAFELK